jgi:c(7)-type cytochrome triheme protein
MRRILLLLAGLLLRVSGAWGGETFELPPLPPPEEFGNIIINRNSTRNGMQPVVFSHWKHRTKYTCRVCHNELDFNMKTNTTEIREVANRKGKFCGACHNGKKAFKLNGNCDKCHSGDIGYNSEKYREFAKNNFPRTPFGDGINWVEALKTGLITPQNFLKTESGDIPFDKDLVLEAGWTGIAPAVFSHKTHMGWLECSSCHPDIFNIKKKTTAHFSMAYILKGKFCGTCHLKVAFPMDDCKRCHPGISRS